MCFGGGNDDGDQEAMAKNKEIDKMIRADEKKASREVKLLLLGECEPAVYRLQGQAPTTRIPRREEYHRN